MDNTDWQRQPLTWSLLKTHFKAWFERHRVALSVAFVVALAIWGLCRYIASTGNAVIPQDAKWVDITNYAQAYDVYKLGDSIILERVRTDGDVFIIGTGFGVAWWLVYAFQEYRSERRQRGFSRVLFFVLQGLFGLYLGFMTYVHTYPSALVLVNPQVIILDPARDLVSLNGRTLGHMSQIEEFEGIHKSAYHSSWSWFGVKLKDGRYYPFEQGESIGANIQPIAAYLNDYMGKLPQKSLWANPPQGTR